MDAGDLKVFQAVAMFGSIGRAAGELNTVQSNVTTRIRHLEDDLGAVLFERHARGVTLTPAGRRLLPYAEKVRTLLKEARRAVDDDGAPAGPLAIGSLETTAALRLPPLLSRFAAANPEVDLTITTNTSACLVRDVLEHRLDGAFVVGPIRHPALEEELVFREELVLVTAPGIKTPEELNQHPQLKIVVFRAGCSYRQTLEGLLAARGLVNVRSLEFGTLGGILGCVAAGIGLTLLPRAVIADDLRSGRVVAHEISTTDSRADTAFIRRADALVTSAMAAFLETMRAAPIRLVRLADHGGPGAVG